MGNNQPGAILQGFLEMEDPQEWRPIAGTAEADDNLLQICCVTPYAATWQLRVWAITQCLTQGNQLVPQNTVLSDPLTYAVTVEAALSEHPQYSTERTVALEEQTPASWTERAGTVFNALASMYGHYRRARDGEVSQAMVPLGAVSSAPRIEELDASDESMSLVLAGTLVGLSAQPGEQIPLLMRIATEVKDDPDALLARAKAALVAAADRYNSKRRGRVPPPLVLAGEEPEVEPVVVARTPSQPPSARR